MSHHLSFLLGLSLCKMGTVSDLKENAEHSGMCCADSKYDSLSHMAVLQRVRPGHSFPEPFQAQAQKNIYEILVIVPYITLQAHTFDLNLDEEV